MFIIKAYPVVSDDEHGGTHNFPRMIFSIFLSSFNGWLPLSFVTSEFFPWSRLLVMLNAFKSRKDLTKIIKRIYFAYYVGIISSYLELLINVQTDKSFIHQCFLHASSVIWWVSDYLLLHLRVFKFATATHRAEPFADWLKQMLRSCGLLLGDIEHFHKILCHLVHSQQDVVNETIVMFWKRFRIAQKCEGFCIKNVKETTCWLFALHRVWD